MKSTSWLLGLCVWAVLLQGVLLQSRDLPRPRPGWSRIPAPPPATASPSPADGDTKVATPPPLSASGSYDVLGVSLPVCGASCEEDCHLFYYDRKAPCHPLCETYGGCYPDYYMYVDCGPRTPAILETNASNPHDFEKAIESGMREQAKQRVTTDWSVCEPLRGLTGKVTYLRVINTCPDLTTTTTTTSEFREYQLYCEQPETIPNVNDRFTLVYRYTKYKVLVEYVQLYQNMYCAYCHGFLDELHFLQPSYKCGNQSTSHAEYIVRKYGYEPFLDFLMQNCSPVYYLLRTIFHPLECEPQPALYVEECNPQYADVLTNFTDLSIGCGAYSSNVLSTSGPLPVVYKNPHCALCNGQGDLDALQCFDQELSELYFNTMVNQSDGKYISPDLPSFSLLVDFDGTLSGVRLKDKMICPPRTSLDMALNTCVNETCPRGQVTAQGQCTTLKLNPILDRDQTETYGLIFQIRYSPEASEVAVPFISHVLDLVHSPPKVVNVTLDSNCTLLQQLAVNADMDAGIQNKSAQFISDIRESSRICVVAELLNEGISDLSTAMNIIQDVRTMSLFSAIHWNRDVLDTLKSMMEKDGFIGYEGAVELTFISLLNHSPHSVKRQPCHLQDRVSSNTEEARVLEKVDLEDQMTASVSIFFSTSGLLYPWDGVPALLSWKLTSVRIPISIWDMSLWTSFCPPRILTCDRVQLVLSDEELADLHDSKISIDKGSYAEIDGSRVIMCIDAAQFISMETADESSAVEGVLTLCGVVLSLVGLGCTIVVYCAVPSLRTGPGMCIINLCVALFLAQLLFEVAPVMSKESFPDWTCIVAGSLQHYSWLAAFLWMNVLAFDSYVTFSAKLGSSTSKTSDRFRFYLPYAWGLPALIVATCLCLHFIEDVAFVYIDLGLCWLKPGQTLLLGFGLPLGVIMLLNIMLFVKTTVALKAAKNAAQHITAQKDARSNLAICLKIFCLMGIPWVLGFIADLSKQQWITYIFIVANSLQGFFIWLSFGLSVPIRKLVRVGPQQILATVTGKQLPTAPGPLSHTVKLSPTPGPIPGTSGNVGASRN